MAREIRVVEDRWGTIRHVVESVAIVAAGLWAAYVFIYQERIKPTLEPPSLEETVTFDPGKTVNGVRIAQLHIVFSNTGHVDTDVYAESESVFGDRFDAAAPAARPSSDPGSVLVDHMVATGKKELVYSHAALYDAAVGGAKHVLLMPGQHFGYTIPIAVKNGRFDELIANVAIVYGRSHLERSHYVHISIQRDPDGGLVVKGPKKRNDDDGFGDDFSVQTTL